jgi:hypothetical protein
VAACSSPACVPLLAQSQSFSPIILRLLLRACVLMATMTSPRSLNAILQRNAIVPEGCEAQWEVEGERCAQITFLGGFQGYRDKQRAAELGKHASLGEVMECLRAQDTSLSLSVLVPLHEEESQLPAAILPAAASSNAGSAPKPPGVSAPRLGGRLPEAAARLLGR